MFKSSFNFLFKSQVFVATHTYQHKDIKLIDNLPYQTQDVISIRNAYSSNLLTYIVDEEKYSNKTGEVYFIYKRKYLNLTFIFFLDDKKDFKKLIVRGSVHYLFNEGKHNANTFTFKDLEATLKTFSSTFGIDLTKCVLLPIEYGNNLYLNEFSEFDGYEIILNTFCEFRKIFYQNVAGIESSIISGSYVSEYRLKSYLKSEEYPNYCTNTLRLETQQKKMRYLNSKGINVVTDLFNVENQKTLMKKHLANLKRIVIFDYTISIPKNSKFKKDIIDFKNPNFWKKLISKCKKDECYTTKYNSKVDILNKLSKKHGSSLLNKLIYYSEKQWFDAMNRCSYSMYKIIRKSNNAQVLKSNNALLCISCKLYDNSIDL